MSDWEGQYQSGDTPWDRGEAAPPLREALQRLPRSVWGTGEVLVPGCGTGHDVRALAAAGLVAVGLDVAPTAVARAETFPKVGAERYLCGDLFDTAWHAEVSCSAVWEHTCFCAIAPSDRVRYVAAMATVLAPGCFLAGVFFLRPEARDDGLPGPPFGISEGELVDVFAAAFTVEDSWVPATGYPGRLGREWVAVFRRK